jgi:hypothetical protein
VEPPLGIEGHSSLDDPLRAANGSNTAMAVVQDRLIDWFLRHEQSLHGGFCFLAESIRSPGWPARERTEEW